MVLNQQWFRLSTKRKVWNGAVGHFERKELSVCACAGIPSPPPGPPSGARQGEVLFSGAEADTWPPLRAPLACQALCKHSRLLPGSGCPGAKGWKPFHAWAQQPAEPHTEGNHPLRGRRRLGRRGTSQRHPCWATPTQTPNTGASAVLFPEVGPPMKWNEAGSGAGGGGGEART